MSAHDARLVPAAIGAWLAAAAVWFSQPWLIAAAACGCAALIWRRQWQSAGAVALVAMSCACVSAGFAIGLAAPVQDRVGDTVTLAGTATSDAAPGVAGPTQGLWRVELAVGSMVDGDASSGVRIQVAVWGDESWQDVVRGDHLELRGKLSPASEPASGLMWRPVILARAPATGADAVVADLRKGLREATAHLPERSGVLTRGMVIGDDAGMSTVQRDQLSRAGLTHLTAVSGAHFSILLISITVAMRAAVRSRRAVALGAAATMGAFVLLVFPEASVVRAATMAAVVCAGLWWGRRAQALPALSVGVLVVTLCDPALALSPGFVMSVLAVASIVLWAPVLAVRFSRYVPTPLAHALGVCVAAQLAVAPVLATIDAAVSPWSLVTNLTVAWCAAPVTIIGLAAVLLAAVWAPAGAAAATVAAWCAWPVDAAALAVEHAPGSGLTFPVGLWGAAAAALALVAAVGITSARRLRAGGAVAALVVVMVIPVVPQVVHNLAPMRTPDWRVVVCDVGQGDAMLLRAGENSAVMIDTGSAGAGSVECLRKYKVSHIPLLILTHPHEDHDGAVSEVIAAVQVDAAWVTPTAENQGAAQVLVRAGVSVDAVSAGDAASAGGVTMTVLAPGAGSGGLEENDASVIIHAHVEGITVLALGDLEIDGQRQLAKTMGNVVVDLVKVAHHGSPTQDEGLASQITARVAAVSVGASNRHGHPAPTTLELYRGSAAVVVTTAECGDLVLTPGPALRSSCPSTVAG